MLREVRNMKMCKIYADKVAEEMKEI